MPSPNVGNRDTQTPLNRVTVTVGSLESDKFDVAPIYEYRCCGHRKELQTWFYPETLLCGVPECRRKIRPMMIAEPNVSPAKAARAAKALLK